MLLDGRLQNQAWGKSPKVTRKTRHFDQRASCPQIHPDIKRIQVVIRIVVPIVPQHFENLESVEERFELNFPGE